MRSVNIICEWMRFLRPGRGILRGGWIGVCLLLGSCGKKAKEVPNNNKKPMVPEEGIQIVSYLSEKGVVKGKLTAPYMLRYQQADTPYTEFPRTLHVDFYNDSLIVESKVDARYGKYMPNLEKVFLRDSV